MRCKILFFMIFAVANVFLIAEEQFNEATQLILDLKNKIDYLDILMKKSNHEKLVYSIFLQLQKKDKEISSMIDHQLLYQKAESYSEFLQNTNPESLKSMIDKFDALVLTKIIASDYQIKQLQNS